MTTAAPYEILYDAAGVEAAIRALAARVPEVIGADEPLFLAGIPTRGVAVAERLRRELRAAGRDCGCGSVDISMHRDDLGMRPGVGPVRVTTLPLDIENWTILLVDDVLHTGRTCRAAMEAVLSFGRPRRILLAALVDRGHRELPIQPDLCGLTVEAAAGDRVLVRLAPEDEGPESVRLVKTP